MRRDENTDRRTSRGTSRGPSRRTGRHHLRRLPLIGQRKNELRKTARIPAPRNECGNSERAGASERTGNAYSPRYHHHARNAIIIAAGSSHALVAWDYFK